MISFQITIPRFAMYVTLLVVCLSIAESIAVHLRLTTVRDLNRRVTFAEDTDHGAWGVESLLQLIRRQFRHQFVKYQPVRSIDLSHRMNHTPIALFPELRELDLSVCGVKNLSPLKHCRNLIKLECAHAHIQDFSALAKLTRLEHLNCSSSNIRDLAPLRRLSSLQELVLDDTHIESFEPLSELEHVTYLSLNRVTVEDWQSVKSLKAKSLQSLSLRDTSFVDVSYLRHLINLRSLDLSNTAIVDLTELQHLPKMEVLDIRGANVDDLSVLRHLPSVTTLRMDLPGDSGEVLSHVAEMSTLQTLELHVAASLDWRRLKSLTQLQALKVVGPIDRVDGAEGLSSLELIHLVDTQVTTIGTLHELPKILRIALNYEPFVSSKEMMNKISREIQDREWESKECIVELRSMDRWKEYRRTRFAVSDAISPDQLWEDP